MSTVARGDLADRDPAPVRSRRSRDHVPLPPRNRQHRDHPSRPPATRTDDPRRSATPARPLIAVRFLRLRRTVTPWDVSRPHVPLGVHGGRHARPIPARARRSERRRLDRRAAARACVQAIVRTSVLTCGGGKLARASADASWTLLAKIDRRLGRGLSGGVAPPHCRLLAMASVRSSCVAWAGCSAGAIAGVFRVSRVVG